MTMAERDDSLLEDSYVDNPDYTPEQSESGTMRRASNTSRGLRGMRRASRSRSLSRGTRARGLFQGEGPTPGTSREGEPTAGPSGQVQPRAPSRPRARKGARGASILLPKDLLRAQEFQIDRVAAEKARIQGLDLTQAHQLLQTCLERDPSMIFDLLVHTEVQDPAQVPRTPGQQPWCVCRYCRHMRTDIEKVCCRQMPDNCISLLPHMDAFILQPGVLRLARRVWNDTQALEDLHTPGESNKQFRFAAYRQYVIWQYGQLGSGHRVVIPSCCVWKICDRYPDPEGYYVGFVPRRNANV